MKGQANMKKNRVKNMVIAAAAYVVYVLAAGLSRSYITPITALGDLIVPFGVFAALEAMETAKSTGRSK